MTRTILNAVDPLDVRLERSLKIGIYDPALGGDPTVSSAAAALRADLPTLRGGWWQPAALFAVVSFAQLLSMGLRRSTLVGRKADPRLALAHAGLLCISLMEVVRNLGPAN